MVGTLNKVILIGNVGKDPEIRTTQDGKEIANFSLATSESWKDKNTGDKREKTEWHKIVIFVPQLVDIVKRFVKKGSKIYIEGSLQTRRWMDNGSVERYVTEVLLQSYNSVLMLLDTRAHSSVNQVTDNVVGYDSASQFSAKSNTSESSPEVDFVIEELKEDDIPF